MIEIQSLSKSYYGKKRKTTHALRNVNIKIEKGDCFGIIGFSGAGKSTLLHCLSTLERPSSGQIWIEGQEVTQLSQSQLRDVRRKLGLIFQNFNVFSSKTVAENIAYPLEIAHFSKKEKNKRVAELIGLVGLYEQKDLYPSQLSGGQKQRVGIARALANDPKILLCDEATSALDPKTTEEILTLIQDLQKELGLTTVLITHEMDVVKRICNKVAVLEQGEVVEMGSLANIFTEPKHSATKNFALKTIHEVPKHLLSGKGKVFHLHFKGEKANQPIITQMVKEFHVDANILLGWIDSLQTVTVGNLIIELTGDNVRDACIFLQKQGVKVEEMDLG